MKNIFFVLFLLPVLFSIPSIFAEEWGVTISSGSSNPSATLHFIPQEITIRPGDFVIWANGDSVIHTVSSGSLESGLDGAFDSGYLRPGVFFQLRFDENDLGEINYFCTLHPWLTGVINVVELETDFKVFHNVGMGIIEKSFDLQYSLQRALTDVQLDPVSNSLIFTLSGNINNDVFVVKLPVDLIENPNTVLIDKQTITEFEIKTEDTMNILSIPLDNTSEIIQISGTDTPTELEPKESVLINQIFAVLDKSFYKMGDKITLSGKITNPSQLYEISIELISPTGDVSYQSTIHLRDSDRFTFVIPTSGVLREVGEYDVKITGPSAKSVFLSFDYGVESKEPKSPLKQMKLGMSPSDVTCKQGLELIKKTSDDTAVCLTESTAKILLERGWADNF